MRKLNPEEEEPNTNESFLVNTEAASADNVPWKNARRLPLADIRNVQEDLSKRFDGKSMHLLLAISCINLFSLFLFGIS